MNNSSLEENFQDGGGGGVMDDDLDITTMEVALTFPSYLRHSMGWTLLFIFSYSVVFVVGFVGNCSVVLVVLRTRSMRTVTNLFILNLACADLLVIIFCIPATLLANILIPWVLGYGMCKTVNYIQGVSVCASVYSLVAISLDKFLAIWFPMNKGMGKRGARIIIVLIWVIAITVLLPWAVVFELVVYEEPAGSGHEVFTYCQELWPKGVNGDLYFLVGNLLICYLLPLGGITFCYVLIWLRVFMRKVPKDSARIADVKRIHRKARFGVLKMLMVVILVFLLSWLPLYSIFIRLKFGSALEEWEEEVYAIAAPIAQWLGSANSCVNPCLYVWLNVKFRRAFIAIIPCHGRSMKGIPRLQRQHAIKSSYQLRQHVSVAAAGATGV